MLNSLHMTNQQIPDDVPTQGSIMCLDVSTTAIGIAISDGLRLTANPITTILRKNKKYDVEAILKICSEHEPVALVVGLPLNMDNSPGPMARKAKKFADLLSMNFDIPVIMWDERLSTFEAKERLTASGVSATKHKELIDQVAAQIILESFLKANKK